MRILAIDTSTRSGSVAYLIDGKVLEVVAEQEETPYSTRLFKDLEVLQSRAGFRIDQIDLFAVASGPGSFTGLRIGLTAAKAWAEVHGKPVVAVSGLEAIAAQSALGSDKGRIVSPFLDARRGQVFGSCYKTLADGASGSQLLPLQLISDESILSPQEFLESVKAVSNGHPPMLVSSTPGALPAALISEYLPGAQLAAVSGVLAPVIGQLGFARALRGEVVDALQLDANYVRRSDAEAAWTDK